MKKISILFVLLLVFSIFPAQAEPESSLSFDYGHGMLSVQITGLTADSSYFLLISRAEETPAATSPENLLFMDMVTSSADGTLDVGLVSMDITEGASVLLGGAFEEVISPYLVGTLEHNTSMPLPDKLKAIDAEAFKGSAFTSLYIGADVASIGDRAFQNCASLRTLCIANDQITFGDNVFSGCTDLVILCSEGSTAAQYAASLNNVTVRYR